LHFINIIAIFTVSKYSPPHFVAQEEGLKSEEGLRGG